MLKDYGLNERFFGIFEELDTIPRGSGNTAAAAEFCRKYAADRGFFAKVDNAGNVIIKMPASKGYEDHETVVIQGHTDMVCQKTADSDHDFTKDGIKVLFDGEKLYADRTTLGGDDGISVAFALSLLDEDFAHPPIEILLTSDEETGMNGAIGLDPADISGRRLINVDSEEEGVITVGCAGGARTHVAISFPVAACCKNTYKVTLCGFAGGHSGSDINKGRNNAALTLINILKNSELPCLSLCSFSGGDKDNAIPRSAEAVVSVKDGTDVYKTLSEKLDEYFKVNDKGADIPVLTAEPAEKCGGISPDDTKKLLNILCSLPNGVQKMSENEPDKVETSLSLGISEFKNGTFKGCTLIRSSDNIALSSLCEKVGGIFESAGGSYSISDQYSAWEYAENSVLRDTAVEVFSDMYGKKPIIDIIHAGLECGILSGKLPGLDSISIGPDLQDIHTVGEKLDVGSARRMYKYLLKLLESL